MIKAYNNFRHFFEKKIKKTNNLDQIFYNFWTNLLKIEKIVKTKIKINKKNPHKHMIKMDIRPKINLEIKLIINFAKETEFFWFYERGESRTILRNLIFWK